MSPKGYIRLGPGGGLDLNFSVGGSIPSGLWFCGRSLCVMLMSLLWGFVSPKPVLIV